MYSSTWEWCFGGIFVGGVAYSVRCGVLYTCCVYVRWTDWLVNTEYSCTFALRSNYSLYCIFWCARSSSSSSTLSFLLLTCTTTAVVNLLANSCVVMMMMIKPSNRFLAKNSIKQQYTSSCVVCSILHAHMHAVVVSVQYTLSVQYTHTYAQ